MEVRRLVRTGVGVARKVIENPNAQDIKSELAKKKWRQAILEFVETRSKELPKLDISKLNTDVEPFSFGGLKEDTTTRVEAAIADFRKKTEEMAKASGFKMGFRVLDGREPSPNRLHTTYIDSYLERLHNERPVTHNIGAGFDAQG